MGSACSCNQSATAFTAIGARSQELSSALRDANSQSAASIQPSDTTASAEMGRSCASSLVVGVTITDGSGSFLTMPAARRAAAAVGDNCPTYS